MSTSLVSPAPSFTFTALQQNLFTWSLTNATGGIITGASVQSTLYSGRQIADASQYPGTPDPIFQNISMPEIAAPSGIYQAIIPATFNPNSSPSGFVVVVTATITSVNIGTWSTAAVVVPAATSIDMVTLNDVKSWLDVEEDNTDDDGLLQILITGFSRYVLNRTGMASFGVNTYTEIYDGNGSQDLFLRNFPVTTVTSVIVGNYTVPQSTGLTIPGWYIDPHQKSIVLRSVGGSGWGWGSGISAYMMVPGSIFPQSFIPGRGNIQVIYQAGFTSLPADLYELVMETIGIFYARKDWKDMASRALAIQGGSGTTVFKRDWLPEGTETVLRYYQRRALI